MGQFLNEKISAGMKNKALASTMLWKTSGKFFACSATPKSIISRRVITTNQLGKSVSTFISLPSLVRNFLPSTKETLLKYLTRSVVMWQH